MPAPTFLCVGFPKCGTSTLYDVLAQQPDLFMPPVKEIQFFAYDKIRYTGSLRELFFSSHWAARQDRLAVLRVVKNHIWRPRFSEQMTWLRKYVFGRRDMDWYLSLFPHDRVCGDISPIYYLLGRQEIHCIATMMPGLKIIILLRSPLQQLWSHCRMVVVRQKRETTVDAFKDHIQKLTLVRRTYRDVVEDWSSEFSGQVFVGYLEDMAADPQLFFSSVFRFLGLEKDKKWVSRDPLIATAKSHVGIPFDVPDDLRDTLADHASAQLEGFDAIAPDRTVQWREELERFRP